MTIPTSRMELSTMCMVSSHTHSPVLHLVKWELPLAGLKFDIDSDRCPVCLHYG